MELVQTIIALSEGTPEKMYNLPTHREVKLVVTKMNVILNCLKKTFILGNVIPVFAIVRESTVMLNWHVFL